MGESTEAPAAVTVEEFNALPRESAVQRLHECCGSPAWTGRMADRRPFQSREAIFRAAEEVWWVLTPEDRFDAYAHHPRIGEKGLREKFADTADLAMKEQSGVRIASEDTLRSLAAANEAYEKKFGTVFIVCATGKSADEMLEILRRRSINDTGREQHEAAGELAKITRIRLENLIADSVSRPGPDR